MPSSFIYVLANPSRTQVFIGNTSDLAYALWQHSTGIFFPTTKRHHMTDLIYLECCPSWETANHKVRAMKFQRKKAKWKTFASCNPGLQQLTQVGLPDHQDPHTQNPASQPSPFFAEH